MACECNEIAFNKLRECWSRHHQKGVRAECECCCSYSKPKSKVKGKFGIAYVIDTPNRKCKPCGWEVEFNDTLSEVENNCKKMMNWVTCPPLGECQNNQTNMCCCTEDAKKLFNNNIQSACCQGTRNQDDLCRYCKEKRRKSEGDCNKKEQRPSTCCCERTVNTNQCMCLKANVIKSQCCLKLKATDNKNQCRCKVSNNRNQCCFKPKPKCTCCRAQDGQTKYLDSIKRCTECCCINLNKEKNKQCFCNHQNNESEEECCCKKTSKKPNCCCQDSESQSSLESCECGERSNINDFCCDCSCPGYKRSGKSKSDKRKKQKHAGNKKDERQRKMQLKETSSKEKSYSNPKQSKNLQGPKPKKERYKGNEKTPFTLITHEEPKKEPDTGQDFYSELQERLKVIKNPQEESAQSVIDSVNHLEETEISKPEYDSTKTSLNKGIKKNEEEFKFDLGINSQPENVLVNENKDTDKKQPTKNENTSNKKRKLLQEIKQKHKKEMEAIHPSHEERTVVEEEGKPTKNKSPEQPTTNESPEQPTTNESPEQPTTKIKRYSGPALLKKIKQERKREMEAIYPNQHDR